MAKFTDPKEVSKNYHQLFIAYAQASSACGTLMKERDELKRALEIERHAREVEVTAWQNRVHELMQKTIQQ